MAVPLLRSNGFDPEAIPHDDGSDIRYRVCQVLLDIHALGRAVLDDSQEVAP